MVGSGFKKTFVCLKTAFLGRFSVLKEATSQWILAQAATFLIVNSEAHFCLAGADVSQRNISSQDMTPCFSCFVLS